MQFVLRLQNANPGEIWRIHMTSSIVGQARNYRGVNSFALHDIRRWSEFIKRWDNPTIGIPEAKGLLHQFSLDWADEFLGPRPEDARETFVRFLLHYASRASLYCNIKEVIEKAREVLVNRVIDTTYIHEKATNELVMAILVYFCSIADEELPRREPGRRKLENFLRMAEGRNHREIKIHVAMVIGRLFQNKAVVATSWQRNR